MSKKRTAPQQKPTVPAKITTLSRQGHNGKRVIFVLEASSLSGGVAVIYQQAALLHKNGWQVSFFSLSPKPDWYLLSPGISWEMFSDYQSLSSALLYEGGRVIKVATWWRTAGPTRDGCVGNEGCFFIQDLEMSYSSLLDYQQLVLQAYQLGLRGYTPSTFVHDAFESQGTPCSYVGLWIKPRTQYDEVKRYQSYPGVVLAVLRRQNLKGFQTLAEYWRKTEIVVSDLQLATYSTEEGAKLGHRHIHHLNPPDPAVAKLYDTARLFVCTSNREGTGMPIAEAMQAGIPVATTNCDGNMSFCIDGETALVVQKGDANALVDASLRLLDDLELCLKLTRNAREMAASMFDYKKNSQKVLDFFENAHAQLN